LNKQIMKQVFCLGLIITLMSCAYHPKWDPMIKVPDFYENQVKVGRLDVVVDPYIDSYKMEYIFNTDLTKKGILALHLIAWNQEQFDYDLSLAEVSIRSFGGNEYTPLSSDVISQKMFKNTLARMAGFGALGTAFIFFTVPFAVGAGVDSYLANRDIEDDYEAKELKKGVIGEQSLFQGFLFFEIANDKSEISSAFNESYRFLLENVLNLKTGEVINIEIPFALSKRR
jgi:hypothetical protein